MSNKVGRNDLCPCGSGKKYKNCCIDKKQIPIHPGLIELSKLLRKARFKECFYPDHSQCSDNIGHSHSLQRRRILSKIQEDGKVIMPIIKPNLTMEFGLKEATTFQGFCGRHDKVIFQPIEDSEFDKSQKHAFLFTYRTLAAGYHLKQEGINFGRLLLKSTYYPDELKDILEQRLFYDNLFIRNIREEKKLFDIAILKENYDALTNVIWEFDRGINFAATGIEALRYDLDGRLIQDIRDENCYAKHIYLTVFPASNKSYAIISWLKSNDSLFESFHDKLNSITEKEKINFINYTLPIMSKNIAIKPSSWDKLSLNQKEEFFKWIDEEIELIEEEGYILNRLGSPPYNLFEI